jgi:uncharacterized protein
MAGIFEVFVDAESYFRFQLKATDGTVMAVSKAFEDKAAAVAGIAAVRDCAGMGLVTDLCPAGRSDSAAAPPAVSVPQASGGQALGEQIRDDQSAPASDFRTRARVLHPAVIGPRWRGAA